MISLSKLTQKMPRRPAWSNEMRNYKFESLAKLYVLVEVLPALKARRTIVKAIIAKVTHECVTVRDTDVAPCLPSAAAIEKMYDGTLEHCSDRHIFCGQWHTLCMISHPVCVWYRKNFVAEIAPQLVQDSIGMSSTSHALYTPRRSILLHGR
jgi:hypothetical protein